MRRNIDDHGSLHESSFQDKRNDIVNLFLSYNYNNNAVEFTIHIY